MKITRYEHYGESDPDKDGDWVLYADVKDTIHFLLQQCAALAESTLTVAQNRPGMMEDDDLLTFRTKLRKLKGQLGMDKDA